MAATLMLSRRFAPLFWCQFFSAFTDNFMKTSLVFLILFRSGDAGDSAALVTAASAVLIAPYFLLSALGGELADRYDKAAVAQWLKFLEIAIAGVAVAGFTRHSIPLLFVALAGFGVIAALFGPIKYGILPDHLPRQRLPGANALIESATFIAILTGTIAAGIAARDGGHAMVFSALVMGFSLLSWLSSLRIPPTGEGAPNLVVTADIVASTLRQLRRLSADRRLRWGAMVTSWFWLVGIVVLSLLPPLVKTLMGGNEDAVTVYLLIFSVAVGVGSGLAAAIARGRIVLRTTLAGAAALGLFAFDIGIANFGIAAAGTVVGPQALLSSAGGLRVAVDLAGMAIGGGLFIVPAFAAVQAWSDADCRAQIVAAVNILNAAFMTGATVVVAVLQKLGVGVPVLFLVIGAATLAVALAMWRTMPAGE